MAAGLLFPPDMQERVIRLVAGTWFFGTQALIDLLCKQPPNGLGVPSDPKAFHEFLLPHKKESENKKKIMLGNKCLYDYESQLLFPKTGETDIKSLDITLLVTVIFNCTSCQKSSSLNFDVDNFPRTQILSKGDCVFFMKELRNVLAHWGLKSIDQSMFEKYWKALEIILEGLGFDVAKEDRDLFQSGPVTQEGKFCKGMVLYRLGLLHDSIQDLEKRVHASESKTSEIDGKLSELAIKLADCSLELAQLGQFTEESTGRLLKDINALGCDLKAVLLIAQEAKVTAERAEALAEDAGATAKRAENTANEADAKARSAELKADEALSKACAVEMTIKETLAQSAFPQGRLVAEMSWDSMCYLEMKLCKDYEPVVEKLGLRDVLQHLNRCNAGGGHPAMNFLISLEQRIPDVKYGKIANCASSFKRNDIANMIQKNECCDVLLSDSGHKEVKEKLATLLSSTALIITKYWADFAYYFGYNRGEVDTIEASIREGWNYRPVKEMFDILIKRQPNFTVDKLREVFVAVKRLDLAQYLDARYVLA